MKANKIIAAFVLSFIIGITILAALPQKSEAYWRPYYGYGYRGLLNSPYYGGYYGYRGLLTYPYYGGYYGYGGLLTYPYYWNNWWR